MRSRLRSSAADRGMTLVEFLMGVVVLAVAVISLLGVSVSQTRLNEHARNLSWAASDAGRVMEELRRQNTACATPTAGSANPRLG